MFVIRWIDGIDESQETDVHYRYAITDQLRSQCLLVPSAKSKTDPGNKMFKLQ